MMLCDQKTDFFLTNSLALRKLAPPGFKIGFIDTRRLPTPYMHNIHVIATHPSLLQPFTRRGVLQVPENERRNTLDRDRDVSCRIRKSRIRDESRRERISREAS